MSLGVHLGTVAPWLGRGSSRWPVTSASVAGESRRDETKTVLLGKLARGASKPPPPRPRTTAT